MQGQRILLGISGGIAAYKTVDLARKLVQEGAQVRCVLTESATHFVSATALQAVTGVAVRHSLWDEGAEAAMSHIELARWADTLLIAPATANTLAKLAQGIADDLLTTLALATRANLVLAPAMNGDMWRHPATQANLALLQQRGARVLDPDSGCLACGEVDVGRMQEPQVIVDRLSGSRSEQMLVGKRVLITAGPTVEDIDPVRFIANRSSGKMGYAFAQAARDLGADVVLVSGPTALPDPVGVTTIRVRSALQMFEAVQTHFVGIDFMIAAAAVADYRVEQVASSKLKKQGDGVLTLTLMQNPDIVAWAAAQPNRGKVIAFAAETENLIAHAQEKLQRKGVDAVLANSVADGAAFDQAQNQLFLISADGVHEFPLTHKSQLAQQVLAHLASTYFNCGCLR
ncbi:MAG: bifunctional phosphopantothenoylcysteine decarboxylase/phosphopantothenate--cysteine ligase CoaBC [Gammaproteobacteria bacterium]|nr:bifunctional phosphopantothenoylcysteine decarboxylase/phosphopantothenate--cysteine ligase CoaBC [Gammaproteobacteria bacterium]